MDSDRWNRLQELFDAVVEMDPSGRKDYLDENCAGDTGLRRQVESLILSGEKADGFIEEAIGDVAASMPGVDRAQEAIGKRFGPYKLLKIVGGGGMGTVYLAARVDDQFRQNVAIKVVRAGRRSAEQLRRFRAERQILATLDHPNIARLLDGGATSSGTPYVVMEYVEGLSIDDYCARQKLSTEDRLRLFRKVCAAVQYSHQNLIVHRDIKPSNILVTADGVPKLVDFGIAKLLKPELAAEPEAVTRAAMRLLTPEYASPEQVRGEVITTASDVYSLGVLLYELLTGHRPHRIDDSSPAEMERVICEEEPLRPSTMLSRSDTGAAEEGEGGLDAATNRRRVRQLTGDLDNIVMMALRKESSRRYSSVEQFSEDIRRYLDGMPIAARKDTWSYRTGKFAGRHRFGVAVSVLALVLLIGFGLTMAFQANSIARERDTAASERTKAQQVSGFLVELFEVSDPSESRGNAITAREILDRGAGRISAELRDQPEVQATLMHTIGKVYRTLGLYDAARPLLDDSLVLTRSIHGEIHPEYASVLASRGELDYDTGNYEAAYETAEDVLALRRQLHGDRHVDVAMSMNNLGWLLFDRGRYDEAEAMHRDVLALRIELLGEEHAAVAESLSNLAAVRQEKGEHIEAEQLHRRALEMRIRLLGPDHPRVVQSLNNLATALEALRRYDEAVDYYKQAAELGERLYGPDSATLSTTLINLGRTAHGMGDYDYAEMNLRRGLELDRAGLGEGHPYVAYDLRLLAQLLVDMGALPEAEAAYRRSLEIYRETLQPDDVAVAPVLISYGSLLLDLDKPVRAQTMIEQGVALWRASLPEGHYRIAYSESVLAHALHRLGRPEEAEALLVRSIPLLESSLGGSDARTLYAVRRLVQLYESLGRREEAEDYRRRLAQARSEAGS